jgi:hypothetical protein
VIRLFGAIAERPLAAVPGWILGLLAAALAAQIAWQLARRAEAPLRCRSSACTIGPSAASCQPRRNAALARLAMLWLQAFDSRGDNAIPYRGSITRAWSLAGRDSGHRSAQRLPLFAAARVYARNEDPEKARRMYEFVFAEFSRDPNRRWPALAHVALLAKHRLHDLPLARRYAAAIQRQTTDPTVPGWQGRWRSSSSKT